MKLLLELSMECESLARSEAVAAAEALGEKARIAHSEPGVLVLDTEANPVELAERLGLCHYVSELLCSCERNKLESSVKDIDIDGPIRVRSTKVGEVKIDLAAATRMVGGIIGASRGVDLHHPKTDIRVVFSRKAHVGRLIGAIDRASFEKRKNRYMPFFYPASLHPKYARAIVNLTRVKRGSRLLDPFCGTGAILVEADMVGLDAIGTDLSDKMISGAGRNLSHVGAEATLETCDVGMIADKIGHVEGIATDPPYGKSTSTKGEGIPGLYKRALRAFSEVLDKGAIVAMVVPEVSLLECADEFRLVEKHDLWVHRSLTRNFCLLKRN